MLIYTGGTFGGWLPNIPARNLSDEEVEQYGGEAALLKTGLYERPSQKSAAGSGSNKAMRGGAENKTAEGDD